MVLEWVRRLTRKTPVPHKRSGIAITGQRGSRRFGTIALLALMFLYPAPVAPSAATESPPSGRDVPTPLMQGAQCMAAVVRAVPGVTDVQVTVSPAASGGAYPVLEFRSVDAF